MKTEKEFTWADLKKAVNRMPADKLKMPVTIWTDDEHCYIVQSVFRLEEDYVDSESGEGCAPKSVMKESIQQSKLDGTYSEGDYAVVYPRGTRIIEADRV
jgi:hypothetical protein